MMVHDVFDAAVISAVVVFAWARRAWVARWAVAGLIVYHLIARAVAWADPSPWIELSVAQMLVALGYLFGPLLTVYGRVVGLIFVAVSISSAAAYMARAMPGGGDVIEPALFGAQAVAVTAAAAVIAAGVARHGRMVSRRRRRRDNRD